MEIYAGLGSYSKTNMSSLCENELVSGVIVGDLFCLKRMFEYPNYDFYYFMQKLQMSGKQVLYQTPMYITDEVLQDQTEIFKFMKNEGMSPWVLVQDIGVALWIKEYFPDFTICWSRMGRNRNNIKNLQFYKFLYSIGIDCVEVDNYNMCQVLEKEGIKACLIDGNINFQTIGRDCYSLFQFAEKQSTCNRLCNERGNYMKQQVGEFKMSINGYVLGEKYSCLNLDKLSEECIEMNNILMIYATTEKEFNERVKLWNHWKKSTQHCQTK